MKKNDKNIKKFLKYVCKNNKKKIFISAILRVCKKLCKLK